MKLLLKILTLIVLLTALPSSSYAQNAQSIYNHGVQLMNKGKSSKNVSTLRSAISQFNKAKALSSNNPTMQKNCAANISACQSIINGISNPSTGKKNATSTRERRTNSNVPYHSDGVVPSLALSQDVVEFDNATMPENAPTVKVSAYPFPNDWTWSSNQDADSAWCKVERLDSLTLAFTLLKQNTSTRARQFTVTIKNGPESGTINVTQRGRDFELSVAKETIIFDKKGGAYSDKGLLGKGASIVKRGVKSLFTDSKGEYIDVTCTSNQYYTSNNDTYMANWYIKKPYPDWLAVVRTKPDGQNLCQAVYIEATEKNTTGKMRVAEVVLVSQDKEVAIQVKQMP